MIGFRTIRSGQRVAVWDRRGGLTLVDGPRRLWLTGQSVVELQRFSAAEDQFLEVRHRDGHAQHLPGPAAIWLDPVDHAEVKVHSAIAVDANEALVVYRRSGEKIERRVVRGPALFMPTENEWLHQFRWHGADPKNTRVQRKIPGALTFSKLRVIPDQMYFDVEDVRSADDALLVVKLMVFFELADIGRMLDQTHDPIADFINAVSADVIDFVARRSFERFKEETEQLNDLATYANLTSRATGIGYRITKVVYRGYHANDKLQAMHDGAIETRTALKLQAETEQQTQELVDLKLEREAQRARQKRELEVAQAEHDIRIQRVAHEETLRQKQTEAQRQREDRRLTEEETLRQQLAQAQQERENRRLSDELALATTQARRKERLQALAAMRELQIDLTRYLVAQYQHPDRLIRIDHGQEAQLHLHEG